MNLASDRWVGGRRSSSEVSEMPATGTLQALLLLAVSSHCTFGYPERPWVNQPLPPTYDKFECREWKWAEQCRQPVRFSIQKSEWPSFLTYKAWDSCQGCLSAGGFAHGGPGGYPADNSGIPRRHLPYTPKPPYTSLMQFRLHLLNSRYSGVFPSHRGLDAHIVVAAG